MSGDRMWCVCVSGDVDFNNPSLSDGDGDDGVCKDDHSTVMPMHVPLGVCLARAIRKGCALTTRTQGALSGRCGAGEGWKIYKSIYNNFVRLRWFFLFFFILVPDDYVSIEIYGGYT